MAILDKLTSIWFDDPDDQAAAIIHSVAVEAGGIGLFTAQIPGDRFVIGGIQVEMIIRLGRVYKKRLDRSNALAIAEAALATAVGPEAVNQVVKYIPGIGNISNMTVAGSITEAIGWLAVKWFKDGTWFDRT